MSKLNKVIRKQTMPLLALRGLTIFPYMMLHFDVGRPKSLKALEKAMDDDKLILLVTQKEAKLDAPGIEDLYEVGTISRIKQMLKLPGGTVRVLVEGIGRARISQIINEEPFFEIETEEKMLIDSDENDFEIQALSRILKSSFEEYSNLSNRISPESIVAIGILDDISQIADVISANLLVGLEDKQRLLSEIDPKQRVLMLLEMLNTEKEILNLEKDIANKVKVQIDKNQREYYLREQLKVIQDELGDKDGIKGEVDDYIRRIRELNLLPEVEMKSMKEADRLLKIPSGSAEGSVVRNYLDWILELPWNNKTEESKDIRLAEKILENDHFGLEKVKERILEYLSIRLLANNLKGPILCLVGPPGVGKTSIAKSIAKALNRKYVRMSLGGVKDESEIRGHRKTYVGSMPGRIINAIKQAGTKNPLILLDEIDKMSSDYKGDPASAMLEVLDSEQNNTFRDHYIEVPFDLSEVLFLTTANDLSAIPRPLLDRMEVIQITGYTEEEKLSIANNYLLPKQIENHGLKNSNIRLDEQVIRDVINYYTREAGVRTLERYVGKICRKVARELVVKEKKSTRITTKNLEKYLGSKIFRYDKANIKDEVGIARGLAWTSVGGETLSIEVNIMDGSGKLELTGSLGDVMKESALAGMSYIRSKVNELGIDKDFYKNKDIHIHIPDGATPKDGPSAGITMATAIISALTEIPVRRDVAMTGEITLRGRVLPIGGLKEKVLAANRAGIKTIIIPIENERDLDEIPKNVKGNIKFIFAESMDNVLITALTDYKFQCELKSIKELDDKVVIPITKNNSENQKSTTIQ